MGTSTFHAAPDDIARLGYAVAGMLDSSLPAVKNLPQNAERFAREVADALLAAKRPVIILDDDHCVGVVIDDGIEG